MGINQDYLSAALWLLFISLICAQLSTCDTEKSTYIELYESAVEAYGKEHWFECSSLMQRTIASHKLYHDAMAECRNQCRMAGHMKNFDASGVDNDALYLELAVKYSDCIKNCQRLKSDGHPELSENKEVEKAFSELLPYDYLQMCAYKSNQYQLAMAAAYTLFVAQPDHIYMKNNVDFYRSLPQAKPSYFVDMEAKPYKLLYSDGIMAYGEENWAVAIKLIEESTEHFYSEHEKCLAHCDSPFDENSFSGFYKKVIESSSYFQRDITLGHLLEVLECRTSCTQKLGTNEFKSSRDVDYLAEHYNYLQFSYFKLGDVKKAAECVSTFLLLKPNDETMTHNRDYYLAQNGISVSDFTPRKEAVHYFTELQSEIKQYRAVNQRLASSPLKGMHGSVFGPHDDLYVGELQVLLAQRNMEIFAENEQLEGDHRVAIDGALNLEQCNTLLELASIGAVEGDGYPGSKSPHTDYESFKGLSVDEAAKLAKSGAITTDQLGTYLMASEVSRTFLEKYFNLRVPLYYFYTHLVCRSALLDMDQTSRSDLSHAIHSDNCNINTVDGSCRRELPHLMHRDITGLIYLNDDFEGGNFFFAFKNMSVQKTVRPKCGRLVGFESGDYHGVLPVTSGKRCALAIWYTFSHDFREMAHANALNLLRSLEGAESRKESNSVMVQALLEEKGYHIVMNESDLNGSERFVADSVLKPEDCQQLMYLVNEGGVAGDGYQSQSSPHTQHEHFAGLTVSSAVATGGLAGDGYRDDKGSPHTTHEVFQGVGMLRAAELAERLVVSAELARLYLRSTESARELVATYFDKNIYFAYTHLVCRTAVNDKNVERTDLSHPIHSDNCIMQPDNSCKRERPAYIERDYSALLYLNDDFEGGDFFFAHQNKSVQSTVRPQCGRLVGFNSSIYHGVQAVLSGQRCAVALWFTMDPAYDEQAHSSARRILEQLEVKPIGPKRNPHTEL